MKDNSVVFDFTNFSVDLEITLARDQLGPSKFLSNICDCLDDAKIVVSELLADVCLDPQAKLEFPPLLRFMKSFSSRGLIAKREHLYLLEPSRILHVLALADWLEFTMLLDLIRFRLKRMSLEDVSISVTNLPESSHSWRIFEIFTANDIPDTFTLIDAFVQRRWGFVQEFLGSHHEVCAHFAKSKVDLGIMFQSTYQRCGEEKVNPLYVSPLLGAVYFKAPLVLAERLLELDPSVARTCMQPILDVGFFNSPNVLERIRNDSGISRLCMQIMNLHTDPSTIHAMLRNGALNVCVRLLDSEVGWLAAREHDLDGNLPIHVAVESGLPKSDTSPIIFRLLHLYPESAQIVNADGWLPIHLATKYGADVDVVQELINIYPNGAKIPTPATGNYWKWCKGQGWWVERVCCDCTLSTFGPKTLSECGRFSNDGQWTNSDSSDDGHHWDNYQHWWGNNWPANVNSYQAIYGHEIGDSSVHDEMVFQDMQVSRTLDEFSDWDSRTSLADIDEWTESWQWRRFSDQWSLFDLHRDREQYAEDSGNDEVSRFGNELEIDIRFQQDIQHYANDQLNQQTTLIDRMQSKGEIQGHSSDQASENDTPRFVGWGNTCWSKSLRNWIRQGERFHQFLIWNTELARWIVLDEDFLHTCEVELEIYDMSRSHRLFKIWACNTSRASSCECKTEEGWCATEWSYVPENDFGVYPLDLAFIHHASKAAIAILLDAYPVRCEPHPFGVVVSSAPSGLDAFTDRLLDMFPEVLSLPMKDPDTNLFQIAAENECFDTIMAM